MTRLTYGRSVPLYPLCLCGLSLLVLSGCAQKNGIVGKWHGSIGTTPGATATVDTEYKADGTEASTIKSPQQELAVTSRYTQQGDVLTETITGVSINGNALPIPATAKTSTTRTVKIDGDSLTLTDSRKPGRLTLARVR